MENKENELICKFCMNKGTEEEPLYYPCKCTGTIKYIHSSCLISWLKSSEKRTCELCKYKYKFHPVYKQGNSGNFPYKLLITKTIQYLSKISIFAIKKLIITIIWGVLIFFNSYFFTLLFNLKTFSNYGLFFLFHTLFGIILTTAIICIAYMTKNLLYRYRIALGSRRIRLSPMEALENMTNEALSRNESQINENMSFETENLSIGYLQSVTSNLRRSITNSEIDESVTTIRTIEEDSLNANETIEETQNEELNQEDRESDETTASLDTRPLEDNIPFDIINNTSPLEPEQPSPRRRSVRLYDLKFFERIFTYNESIKNTLSLAVKALKGSYFILLTFIKIPLLLGKTILRFFSFENEITRFLKRIKLYNIAYVVNSYILGYTIVLLCIYVLKNTLFTKKERREYNSMMRDFFIFMKIYIFFFIEIFYFSTSIGILLHFSIYKFVNNHEVLVDPENFYILRIFDPQFKELDFVLMFFSYVLHTTIGFLWMFFVAHTASILKDVFRPGAIYILNSPSSEYDPINEIMRFSFKKNLLGSFASLMFYSLNIIITFISQKYILKKLNVKISVKNIFEVIVILRSSITIFQNRKFFYDALKRVVLMSTKIICKITKTGNYFFNEKIDNIDKNRIKWCPNRNMKYKLKKASNRYRKGFTDNEFKKYFVSRKRNDKKYSLFYIPPLFNLSCSIITLFLTSLIQVYISFYLYFSFRIAEYLKMMYVFIESIVSVSEYSPDSTLSIVFLILGFAVFLFVLNAFTVLYNFLKRGRYTHIISTISILMKGTILNFYSLIVWPMILGVHIKLLVFNVFSSEERVRIVLVSRVFIIGIISSTFVLFLFKILGVIDEEAIESLSFYQFFKNLILITNLMCLIVAIPYVFDLILKGFVGYKYRKFLYLAATFAPSSFPLLIIGCYLFLKRIKRLVSRIRDDLYLVERRLMNYNSEIEE